MTGQSIGASAARGAAVTFAGQLARMVLQIASVIVLARFLAPEEYGLVTMVLVIVGVGEIFRDFGLSTAAVRAPTLSEQQRVNLFWINTGIGLVLGGAFLAAAPLLEAAYGEPGLVPLAQALAGIFVLNGLATQLRADLNRRMKFATLAGIDVGAQGAGFAVAVVLAVLGAGPWALVAQHLVQATVVLGALAVAARWRPGLPRRGEPMRPLLAFGWNLVASQLLGYLGNNIDNLVIGGRLGPGALGLYNRAYTLVMTPIGQVRAPSTTVALPVLSRLLDQPERFARFVRRGQLALAYPVMVVVAIVVGTAGPATRLLLGPDWTGIAPLVQLLAAAALFQTLAYVGYWVYLACGLSAELMRYTLVTTVLKIVLVVVGSRWGVVGVAAGYAVAPALAWPLSIWWLSRLAPIPAGDLVRGALRVLAVGCLVASTAAVLSRWGSDVVATTVGALGGLLVLVVVQAVVPPIRRDVRDGLEIVQMALAGRRERRRPA